jgi:hypothetical protein
MPALAAALGVIFILSCVHCVQPEVVLGSRELAAPPADVDIETLQSLSPSTAGSEQPPGILPAGLSPSKRNDEAEAVAGVESVKIAATSTQTDNVALGGATDTSKAIEGGPNDSPSPPIEEDPDAAAKGHGLADFAHDVAMQAALDPVIDNPTRDTGRAAAAAAVTGHTLPSEQPDQYDMHAAGPDAAETALQLPARAGEPESTTTSTTSTAALFGAVGGVDTRQAVLDAQKSQARTAISQSKPRAGASSKVKLQKKKVCRCKDCVAKTCACGEDGTTHCLMCKNFKV